MLRVGSTAQMNAGSYHPALMTSRVARAGDVKLFYPESPRGVTDHIRMLSSKSKWSWVESSGLDQTRASDEEAYLTPHAHHHDDLNARRGSPAARASWIWRCRYESEWKG